MKSSEKKATPRKNRSLLRRIFTSFFRRIVTCCGKSGQLPEELKERDEILRRCTVTPEAFQLLVRERALEVRREAKEWIEYLNSRTDPRVVFPTEIWLKILKDCQPASLASMREFHEYFEDLILVIFEKKCYVQDFQLPLMLDFKLPLVHRHVLPAQPYYYQLIQRKDELCPLIALRRVCKSFRDGIDLWIESRLLHLMRTYEFVDCSYTSAIAITELSFVELDTCIFWERIPRILQYSRGPLAERPKQFVVRSLNIAFLCDSCNCNKSGSYTTYTDRHGRQLPERFPIFRESITEFLGTVGDQIMHMMLVLPPVSHFQRFGIALTESEFHGILREWLLLVPNLKWLQINATHVDTFVDNQQLLPVMPTLRNLERFDFQGWVKEAPIWHSILNANPQICRINVLGRCTFPSSSESTSSFYERACAAMKTEVDILRDPRVLALPLEVAHFGKRSVTDWDLTLPTYVVQNNQWNLHRLSIWMDCRFPRSLSLGHVFRFLQNFQTLEDVEIHILHSDCEVKTGKSFLLLPNLKQFKLELGSSLKKSSPEEWDFFFSLMFLLECKKLASLVWLNELYDSEELWRQLKQRMEYMMTNFMGGFENLCESNVWRVFPKLRRINVRFRLPEKKFGGDWEYLVRKYQDRELVYEKEVNWKDLMQYR